MSAVDDTKVGKACATAVVSSVPKRASRLCVSHRKIPGRRVRIAAPVPRLPKPRRRLVECFMFYNEFDVLKLRMAETQGVVDASIAVEATHTFSGRPKPLHLQEKLQLVKKGGGNKEEEEENYSRLTVYTHVCGPLGEALPVEGKDGRASWDREYDQRNAGLAALYKLKLAPHDLVLMGDVDEIPDARLLRTWKANGLPQQQQQSQSSAATNATEPCRAIVLEQRLFYYSLRTAFAKPWSGPVLVEWGELVRSSHAGDSGSGGARTLQDWRHMRIHLPNVRCGWHLSYYGDVHFVANKLKSFAHTEYAGAEYSDPDIIAKRIAANQSLFVDQHGTDPLCVVDPETDTDIPCHYKLLLSSNSK